MHQMHICIHLHFIQLFSQNPVFHSLTDTGQDAYMEEREAGDFAPKTDETHHVQQKPVSRGKLEARTESIRVQHLPSW